MGALVSPHGIEQRISAVHWFHSIDLGGVLTPGHKTPAQLAFEASHLPDVRGRSVLDIGAWDGYFSFECERRGASRVTSLDHFVWHMDIPGWHDYGADCVARGVRPLTPEEAGFYFPDSLPGKAGYDLAHETLGSRAEPVVCDYMHFEGSFDVVLYMGVLYHMKDPLPALEKVASLAREVAVIETEAAAFPGTEHVPLLEFFPRSELRLGDPTNYFAPNLRGLTEMCLAAGFKRVEVRVGPSAGPELSPPLKARRALGNLLRWLGLKPQIRRDPHRYRAVVLAWKV
jgi:tRNA (mo5U34)-methyltransferase